MRQNSRSPSRLRPSSSLALPRGEEQPSPRDRDRSQHTTLHDQVYEGVDHFLAWSKSQILMMPTNEMNFQVETHLSSDLSNLMGRHDSDPAGTTKHSPEDDNSSGGGSSLDMKEEEVVDNEADERIVNTIEQTHQHADMHEKSHKSGSITRSKVSGSEQRHASSGAGEPSERTESEHQAAEQAQGEGEHDPVGMKLEDVEQQAPQEASKKTPTLEMCAPDLPGVIPLETSGQVRVSLPTSVSSGGGRGNIGTSSPAASKMSAMDVD
eukprot:gnl/TRDRNA2_/TRDRNA2_176187_c0_seq5.p1 gnl/TRDRNA2_/TRDRNA2_176187_c0~~gnl/TRDRNA2_/TRDRNA2_176187_c0_seq5.p1  ORF type:complete len:266 (-),score=40.45 gnl/TRDRNA2_/TRDRNA2_176187_c0_seq5:296-1093(-)